MASREIVPERVIEHAEPEGYWWEVNDPRKPSVEVWADRAGVVIRQDTPGMQQADLIELSWGQAYDLLSVISRALDNPMRS